MGCRPTAGLPLFISFLTSYRELTLPCDVLHVGLANCGGRMFRGRSSSLLEAKPRKSIDNPGEEWLSPWATSVLFEC
jgi:hypothetical protein